MQRSQRPSKLGAGRDLMSDWLSRVLARSGALPLAEAELAIREGRVTVNKRVIKQPLSPVPPNAIIRLDGKEVSASAATLVLMFHKPAGTVTSRSEREGDTVFHHMLPSLPEPLRAYSWHAVGRLDRDTTGLLLFTNDEKFVGYATRPTSNLQKRYVAQVHGEVTDEKLRQLTRGVPLDEGQIARAVRTALRPDGSVEMVLTEGRFHQVKRMLGAVGLPVHRLHRDAIGELILDVPEGNVRPLSEAEVRTKLFYPPDSK